MKNKSLKSSSSEATSKSLLRRVKRSESDAWEQLIELYSPLVYQWSLVQGVPKHDISDVSQETFQSVARSIGRFQHEQSTDSFRGWLWTIARNKILDYFRKQAKHVRGEGGSEAFEKINRIPALEPEPPNSSEIVYISPHYLAAERIRKDFTAKTWQAFWNVSMEKLSVEVVADQLNMTANAVRIAKYRVLRRLREEFGEIL